MTIKMFDMFMADVIRKIGKCENITENDLRKSPVVVRIDGEKFPVKSVGFDLDDWDDPWLLLCSGTNACVDIMDVMREEERLIPAKEKICDINNKGNEITIGDLIEIFKEFGKAGWDFEIVFSENRANCYSDILFKKFEYYNGTLIINATNSYEENLDQNFDILYDSLSECKKKMQLVYLYNDKYGNEEMYDTIIDVLKGIDKIKENLEKKGVD
jgi:hypothetical protein